VALKNDFGLLFPIKQERVGRLTNLQDLLRKEQDWELKPE
jgi:hypothetical protein